MLLAILSACANLSGSSGRASGGDAGADGTVGGSSGAEASSTSGTAVDSSGSGSSTSSSSGGQGATSSSSGSAGCDASVETDPNNCGRCGFACPSSSVPNQIPVCAGSSCALACRPGYSPCLGGCVTYGTPDNCGACDNICGVDGGPPLCAPSGASHACATTCPSSAPTSCNGACVDTRSTATACGPSCTACATGDPNGQPACVNGACAVACNRGYTLCNGECVSLRTSAHCGYCDVSCKADSGTPLCLPSAGGGPPSCASGCPLGQSLCGEACVDRSTDVANCGSCGTTCTRANAVATCSRGSCGFTCAPGYTLCNGACVDTTSDPANCGGCWHQCAWNLVCTASACTSTCGGSTPTPCSGACVNTSGDPDNCGGCGARCATNVPNAHAACASGGCTYACGTGYTPCNGACVDLLSDDYNCGGCGAPCASPDSCQSGQCKCDPALCSNTCAPASHCCKSDGTCGCTLAEATTCN